MIINYNIICGKPEKLVYNYWKFSMTPTLKTYYVQSFIHLSLPEEINKKD